MTEEQFYPVLDRLEERLNEGYYIVKQHGSWWLCSPEGERHCSGKTIRDMLVNLIFMD